MATREIKTTISLDGEQSFKKALASATGEMRVLESELKAVSAAYDVNGNSAQFFAAKQQNLRNQISQQREIVQSLERAVEDAAQAYGESSSQVDGYAIRLNNARARMSRLEKELEATAREVEELGRAAVRAGRQLEDGIGEGAEQAESSLKSLISTMQQDISSIRTSSAVSAVTGLWDLATGAYNAVTGFVEGSVEYRRQLSFLVQNAETKGFDFEEIKNQLISVQSLTGDASSAVEGLSNLLAADVDETRMEKAVNNLAGAVISFPETLKFESLADGLQETLATGSATGAFAEALDRLGVDVEAFNKALEESPTAAGDLDIALSYLAAHGMEDVYKKWQVTNGAMDDAARTQAELEFEMARFGGTLEEYITTPIKQIAVDAMKYINDVIALAEEKGADVAAEKVMQDAADIASENLANATTTAVQKIRETAEGESLLVSASKHLILAEGDYKNAALNFAIDETLGDAVEGLEMLYNDLRIGEKLTAVWDKILKAVGDEEQAKKNASQESVANLDAEAEAFKRANQQWEQYNAQPTIISPENEPSAPIGVREDWQEILKGIEADTKEGAAALQQAGADAGTALATGFEQAEPTENLFPTTVIIETENARPAMTTAGQDAGQALAEGFEDSVREVEQTGGEAGEGAGQAFVEGANGYESQAYRMGAALGSLYADGIASQYGRIVGAASKAGAGALGALSVAPGGNYGPPAPSGNVTAVLNLDGRTFARITAPYMAAALVKP